MFFNNYDENSAVEILKTRIRDHFTVKGETNFKVDALEENAIPRRAWNSLIKGFLVLVYNLAYKNQAKTRVLKISTRPVINSLSSEIAKFSVFFPKRLDLKNYQKTK